jgi:hypothetical protein
MSMYPCPLSGNNRLPMYSLPWGVGGALQYQEAADVTRAIFKDYDPHFSAGSLDEAYLGKGGGVRTVPAPAPIRGVFTYAH